MAIKLEDKANVIAPAGSFPYGDVKDNSGANDGTPLDRAVMSDYFQFFAKMLDASGIIADGVLDSNANGYQYFQALVKAVNLNNSAGVIETNGSGIIKTRVLPIGDWDMDTNSTVSVAHGIASPIGKIKTPITAMIRNDNNTEHTPLQAYIYAALDFQQANGAISFDGTNVILRRQDAFFYDSVLYDSTSYNRGWITIHYEE